MKRRKRRKAARTRRLKVGKKLKRVRTWADRIKAWGYGMVKRNSVVPSFADFSRLITVEGSCLYCCSVLTPENASLDHKIPLSRNGWDGLDNFRIICYPCNRAKGSLNEVEFVRLVESVRFSEFATNLLMRKLRAAWRVR